MDWKKIVIMVLVIIGIFIIGGVALFLYLGGVGLEEETEIPTQFNVLQMGRAGDYGYVIYDFIGSGNVTLVSYRKESSRKITIISDDEGIEMDDFDEFVEMFTPLEKYGYTIETSSKRVLGDGIYIVPTGAMPTYVLDDLENNVTEGVVIFLGKKNLVLRSGMQERQWYDKLNPEQRDRILVYEKTLKEYMEDGEYSVVEDILENKWSFDGKEVYQISGEGKETDTINMPDGRYLRVIYDLGDRIGLTDSIALPPEDNVLSPDPQSKYPWEDSILTFYLNQSDGYAYFTALKDDTEVASKKLMRVTNGSIFRETLEYQEPGNYVLGVRDNTGIIASGILHVKELKIEYSGSAGYNYYFDVTVDGVPLKSGEIKASLNNSTEKKKYYIGDGELSIGAKLQQGKNVFNMDIEGTTIEVPVVYEHESLFDFYVKYGVPGILLVFVIYAGARLSRRPVYILKATEGSREIRKEVRVRHSDLVAAFKNVRRDIKIGKSPITAKEFEIAIKRYITKGADITEGNIDEMLKRLVNKGALENYREYYQFAGEGDIKQKTLLRMIREKLIENGISFRVSKNRFITKDYEIGLFGENFKGKALIVVDDENEIKKIMDGLSDGERVKLRIKEANGLVTFVPVDKLGMVL